MSVFGVILVRIFPHSDWIYREIRIISPYSVWMGENMDQNNSEYRHFSRDWHLHVYKTRDIPEGINLIKVIINKVVHCINCTELKKINFNSLNKRKKYEKIFIHVRTEGLEHSESILTELRVYPCLCCI